MTPSPVRPGFLKSGAPLLRIGIVGCGQIAEYHLRLLSGMPHCRVVAVVDMDLHRARRLAARYGSPPCYPTFEAMQAAGPLNVVHVLTPPASHYDLARRAIDHGLHVFVEKPMALQGREVGDLYDRAAARGVSVCPDFLQLFHPRMQQAAALIDSGALGRVIHCESRFCVDVNLPELTESPRLNWAYSLPGGLLHNYITHPLYLVLRWLGPPQRVLTVAKPCGVLPQGITDHLEILLEGSRITGHITMSLAPRPPAYALWILCDGGLVTVDFTTLTVLVEREGKLPRSLGRVTANLSRAYQLGRGVAGNVCDTLRGRLIPYHGLHELLRAYHASLLGQAPPPVPRWLAVAVGQAEESIAGMSGHVHVDTRTRPSRQTGIGRPERVLVTGATGYFGTELVRTLAHAGYYVRVLVRPLGRTEALERLGVEIRYGDIRDAEAVARACDGMDVVVHAAAGLRGTREFMVQSCRGGTENVARAARAAGVQHVIYISSASVYDYAALREGSRIRELSPLEPRPEQRGAASLGKRMAETVALREIAAGTAPAWTILRPAVMFGRGRTLAALAGWRVGRVLLHPGLGGQRLRLVAVHDVARAVLHTIPCRASRGRVFNVAHPDTVTVRRLIDLGVRSPDSGRPYILPIPYVAAAAAAALAFLLRRVTGRGPRVSFRQLAYLFRDASLDGSEFMRLTGWRPTKSLVAQLRDAARSSARPDPPGAAAPAVIPIPEGVPIGSNAEEPYRTASDS